MSIHRPSRGHGRGWAGPSVTDSSFKTRCWLGVLIGLMQEVYLELDEMTFASLLRTDVNNAVRSSPFTEVTSLMLFSCQPRLRTAYPHQLSVAPKPAAVGAARHSSAGQIGFARASRSLVFSSFVSQLTNPSVRLPLGCGHCAGPRNLAPVHGSPFAVVGFREETTSSP